MAWGGASYSMAPRIARWQLETMLDLLRKAAQDPRRPAWERQRAADYAGQLAGLVAGAAARPSLGVVHWNPKYWGMSEEEYQAALEAERAQEIADAQAAAEIARIEADSSAYVAATDPGLTDALNRLAQSGAGTMGFGWRLLMWGGLGLVGVFLYREFVKPAGTKDSYVRQAYNTATGNQRELLRLAAARR